MANWKKWTKTSWPESSWIADYKSNTLKENVYIQFIFLFIITNVSFSGYAEKRQINFHEPATSMMEEVISSHHDLMFSYAVF